MMNVENYRKIFNEISNPNRVEENFEGFTKFDKTALHLIWLILAAFQLLVVTLKLLKIEKFEKFTKCFEYKKSLSSLFEYQSGNVQSDEITCICGVKVLACLSVILYHTVLWKVVNFIASMFENVEMTILSYGQIDFMATSVVEPFFIVSAILTTRSVMTGFKSGNYNFLQNCIKRYFRMAPLMLFMIVVDMTLQTRANCQLGALACWKSWWKKIFFIGDFCSGIGSDSMCHTHTWYLDVDFKLSLITPFLIIGAMKIGVKPLRLFSALIVAAAAYRMFIRQQFLFDENSDWNMNFSYTIIGLQKMLHIDWTTALRCSTYFVGVVFGIYLETNRKSENIQTRWIKCAILLCGIFYYALFIVDLSKLMSLENFVTTMSIIEPLHKICYASFVGFIITFCYFEKSSMLNKFLSARVFKTLSKLTFGIYLVHPFVQYYKQLVIGSKFSAAEYLMIELSVATLFSVILHVIIEEPFRKMGNLIAAEFPSKSATNENSIGELKKEN